MSAFAPEHQQRVRRDLAALEPDLAAEAPTLQRRLRVGASDDPLEREADTVARDVVGRIRATADKLAFPSELDDTRIHRSATVGAAGGAVDASVEDRIRAARGRPLPASVNRSMSGAMGADFSSVRIHDDATSSELNAELSAEAFTVGPKVFLARKFDGTSRHGQELLAHELTHVVQQGAAQRVMRSPAGDAHRSACRCPGCATTSAPEQVSRRLDNKYTSANVKAAGHSTSYFLTKSTFQELLDALDSYFLAGSASEQFTELSTVKTRAAAFLTSKTRTKTRKGSDQAKELAKVQLVQTLQTDAQTELDALDAAPTNDLMNMHMAKSEESLVLLVAKNIAAKMNTDLTTLAGLTPAVLQARFITEVYLPQYMDERAGRKAPGLSVAEQLDQIRSVARVDPNKLTTGSDAKILFTLFETADIGKSVNRLADPKFGTGSEQYVPQVEGWSASNAMTIKGNDTYRARVIALIDEIAQTKVGVALLAGIGGASTATSAASKAVHSVNKTVVAEVKPPGLANVNYQDSTTGQYMYANSAGGQTATVDAFNDIIGSDPAQAKVEAFRLRDAVIGLFHELVHVYMSKVSETFVSLEDPNETMSPGQMYEPRVAGIKVVADSGGKKVTFPFDDATYAYVTENTFRREYARLKGQSDYYVRPYYLKTDASEVQGPTDKQKV